MTRQQCEAVVDYKRCTKVFRSRKLHTFCRECYRKNFGHSRKIESRELSDNKYRRNRKRRGVTAKAIVPKVIQNRNRNKNAIS